MAYTGERISPEDVKRSIKAIPYSDTYNKAAAIQTFNRTCEELKPIIGSTKGYIYVLLIVPVRN